MKRLALFAVRRLRRALATLDDVVDPPVVVLDVEPTVAEWLQHRLAADEQRRARNAELIASLTARYEAGLAEMARMDAEHEQFFGVLN